MGVNGHCGPHKYENMKQTLRLSKPNGDASANQTMPDNSSSHLIAFYTNATINHELEPLKGGRIRNWA